MQKQSLTHKLIPTLAAVVILIMLVTALAVLFGQSAAQLLATQPTVSGKTSHPVPTYLTPTTQDVKELNKTVPLYRADLGTWQYDAFPTKEFGQDTISLGIRYNDTSMDNLKAYVETNKKLAAQLAAEGGTAYVLVTFRSCISPAQARTWYKAHELKLDLLELRAVQADGLRVTGSIMAEATQDYDPLAQSVIDRQLAQFKVGDKLPTFKGIFMIKGEVDAKQLTAITNDPQVFLADVTTEYATRDLAAAKIAGADKIDSDEHSPIWQMEDYGFINYR